MVILHRARRHSRAACTIPLGRAAYDPSQLTQAFAKGARDRGAKIERFTRVVAIERIASGEWRARTGQWRGHVRVSGERSRLSRRRSDGDGRATICLSSRHVASISRHRADRRPRGTQGKSCRCCGIRTPATILGRRATVCCSALMNGGRRRIGWTRSPRTSRIKLYPGRSRPAGKLYRGRHRPRAHPGVGRRAARHQRADPLFAGRQPP